MRVTLASYHTATIRHGGPSTQIRQTKRHLEHLGVEAKLMDVWGNREDVLNCDLFHLFASNLGVYDLAGYLKSHDIRFVVSPIFFTRRSPITVRTVCGIDSVAKKVFKGLWSAYGIAKEICVWSERVLPNTSEESKLVVDGLSIPGRKVTVIPNGVDERFAHADPKLFHDTYGIKDFILNVGHIGPPRKNVLSLIRALSAIHHPAVIIGNVYPGKEADACLREAEENENLLIIPGLAHDSPMLASAYAAASVFVLPARYETPGIAALEAALAGAKVVITPHGGTTDYFGDMAIYVNPYAIKSIRNGIMEALEKRDDDALRNHIRKNYLWDKVARRTFETYSNVIGH